MTIQRAIEVLTKMKERHGDVEVLFDCPYCGKSTVPTTIVAMVVARAKHEAST